MRICLSVLTLFLLASSVCFADDGQYLKVDDPYIEMHTGPGRGYPIFYVVPRGEWVQILYRKTDWYQVKTDDGKEGWVSGGQLAMTLNPSGKRVDIRDPNEEDFIKRSWEYGIMMGDGDIAGGFGDSAVITFFVSFYREYLCRVYTFSSDGQSID